MLVDLDRERYFSLNPSGSVAWGVLAGGAAAEDAVTAIVDSFDVSSASARADVSDLIEHLLTAGLLRPAD